MQQVVFNYAIKLIPFWWRVLCSSTRSKSRNKLYWDANNAVGLTKQRKVGLDWYEFLCFLSPTIQCISVYKTNHAIHWIVIYPVDTVIHFLKNRGLVLCQVNQARKHDTYNTDKLVCIVNFPYLKVVYHFYRLQNLLLMCSFPTIQTTVFTKILVADMECCWWKMPISLRISPFQRLHA